MPEILQFDKLRTCISEFPDKNTNASFLQHSVPSLFEFAPITDPKSK